MVDDHSRLAYSALLDDVAAITCLEYTKRAVQWFADRGVRIAEIMADNGSGYRAHLFHDTVESVGIHHIYIRAYRPQTNGKVERFQQTLDREWTAARLWTSNRQREAGMVPYPLATEVVCQAATRPLPPQYLGWPPQLPRIASRATVARWGRSGAE